MSASAQIFSRRMLKCLATCAIAFYSTALAQERDRPVPTAEVAQAIERVRSSRDDESIHAQALTLGGALLRESRYAEAAELFDALARKRPRDAQVLYGAALATFNTGRAKEAEPLARSAVDAALSDILKTTGAARVGKERSAADALVLLAVVLAVRGDDAGALRSVEHAVRLAPDNFDAQLALGRALFGMGDDAGAARAFRAAVALKPADARALFFLATALEHGGDAEAALAAYRELIARQPRMAEGHLGLGVLLLKRGGNEEGIRALLRALEINPNLYEARIALGRALVTQRRAGEAVEHLRLAAELAPDNPEPHYQLSLAYRQLGRKEEAAAESVIVKRIHEARRGGTQASAPTTPDK